MAAPAPDRARPMPVHSTGSAYPSLLASSRSSRCRAFPAEVVSSDRRRICSPVSASSRDSSRRAAARASDSVDRTITCAR